MKTDPKNPNDIMKNGMTRAEFQEQSRVLFDLHYLRFLGFVLNRTKLNGDISSDICHDAFIMLMESEGKSYIDPKRPFIHMKYFLLEAIRNYFDKAQARFESSIISGELESQEEEHDTKVETQNTTNSSVSLSVERSVFSEWSSHERQVETRAEQCLPHFREIMSTLNEEETKLMIFLKDGLTYKQISAEMGYGTTWVYEKTRTLFQKIREVSKKYVQ